MRTTAQREKSPDLAILLGIGKGGKGKMGMGSGEESDEDESEGELDPDFEEAAIEAFPELEGEQKRLLALQEAIRALR